MADGDVLNDMFGSIRAMRSKQQKLKEDLVRLQSQLKSECERVGQTLENKVKQLKEVVLCCPPTFVRIAVPEESKSELNFDRDSERPWISSCFYTHPGGYKLCLALKSIRIPLPTPANRTIKAKLFIAVLAVSQEDDNHRTWPCEGKITLKLVDQRECDWFTKTFSIEKSRVIQPDIKVEISDIKGWVRIPEEAIPLSRYYRPGSHRTIPSCDDDSVPCYPPPVGPSYITSSSPGRKLDIRIETVSLDEESEVWNCSKKL